MQTITYESLTIHQDSRKVDGLGGEIWNGAYVLARYMEQHASLFKDADVIELGSGCGLCGLVAGLLSPKSVVLTDEYPDLLELNIRANQHVISSKIMSETLDWEQPVENRFQQSFDIAIGSEITQLGRDLHLPLLKTIQQILRPSSVAFLSMDVCKPDCLAQCKSCIASDFVRTAKSLGFQAEIVFKTQLSEQMDCQNHIGVNGKGTRVDDDDYSAVFQLST